LVPTKSALSVVAAAAETEALEVHVAAVTITVVATSVLHELINSGRVQFGLIVAVGGRVWMLSRRVCRLGKEEIEFSKNVAAEPAGATQSFGKELVFKVLEPPKVKAALAQSRVVHAWTWTAPTRTRSRAVRIRLTDNTRHDDDDDDDDDCNRYLCGMDSAAAAAAAAAALRSLLTAWYSLWLCAWRVRCCLIDGSDF
jgi:hypothetical protein